MGDYDTRRSNAGRSAADHELSAPSVPGRGTLYSAVQQRAADARAAGTSAVPGRAMLCSPLAVQRAATAAPAEDPAQVHAAAARGTATSTSPLPFFDVIQRAFGRHDISGVKAHTGADAAASAREMGAKAYATGDHVVLGEGADLHTVAHEAAHVVQQRGGVQLKGGVGETGDAYERHADAVADAVVAGRSAEALFDGHTGGPGGGAVQRVQVGPGLDTRDPSHAPAFKRYLDTLSNPELIVLHGRVVAESHDNAGVFTMLIEDAAALRQLRSIARAGEHRRGGRTRRAGNWANAVLYIDGKMASIGKTHQSGSGSAASPWAQTGRGEDEFERRNSERDSEVALLDELTGVINERLGHVQRAEEIRIDITSTNGACDGCKWRLHEMATRLKEFLARSGQSFPCKILIKYAHVKAPRHTQRNDHPTAYGWPDEAPRPDEHGLYHHVEETVWPGTESEMGDLSPEDQREQLRSIDEERREHARREESQRQQMQQLQLQHLKLLTLQQQLKGRFDLVGQVQRLDERQFRFADFEALRRLQQTAREHPRPAQAAMSTPMWAILIYAGIVELGSMCMFSTHTVQQIRVHEDRLALLPEVLMNLRISAESPDAPRYVGAGYTWDATRR